MLFFRDRIYVKKVLKYKDPEIITLNDLKTIPMINIIVPAWNEGDLFKECLFSITELSYPKLKVIVNAGGSEECINIAQSFKEYPNFIILHQKGGGTRAELGKIKALNECLDYVDEGILYFVDADVYFTDEVLLRMIYPIVNEDENVVASGIKPLKKQENNDFVKYLQINQNTHFRRKFSRYTEKQIGGANTCIKYEAMKKIGKFNQNGIDAEDVSRAEDIIKSGFKIFTIIDYRGMIHCEIADKFSTFFHQKIRWNENSIIYAYRNKNYFRLIKNTVLYLISIYLLIVPFLIFFNKWLFFYGLLFFISIYLNRVRRILFFNKIIDKKLRVKLHLLFYIKIIFYIYLEVIVYIIVPFDLIRFLRKIGKPKSNSKKLKLENYDNSN